MEKSSLYIDWISHFSSRNNFNTINSITHSNRLSQLDSNQSNWSEIHSNQNSNVNSLNHGTHRSTCRRRTLSSWNNHQFPSDIHSSNEYQFSPSLQTARYTVQTKTSSSTMGNWYWYYEWSLTRWNPNGGKGYRWRKLEGNIIILHIDKYSRWLSVWVDGYLSFKGMSKCIPPIYRKVIQAIMFNDILSKDECAGIIQRLSGCTRPFICAHGRPCIATIVQIPHSSSWSWY